MKTTLLVPKGAEYQAVCKGLRQVTNPPTVRSLPVGSAVRHFLSQTPLDGSIVVMGLCGSLTPSLTIGDRVLYNHCCSPQKRLECDRGFSDRLAERSPKLTRVTGFTSDRVISVAAEKRQLGQDYRADVVDMEGLAILQALSGTPVAMLRVVSDDCWHDLPDLSAVFSPDGDLRPLRLAGAMAKRPIAASYLIRGSLRGLAVLQQWAIELYQ